jgi:hypothetical protein
MSTLKKDILSSALGIDTSWDPPLIVLSGYKNPFFDLVEKSYAFYKEAFVLWWISSTARPHMHIHML